MEGDLEEVEQLPLSERFRFWLVRRILAGRGYVSGISVRGIEPLDIEPTGSMLHFENCEFRAYQK